VLKVHLSTFSGGDKSDQAVPSNQVLKVHLSTFSGGDKSDHASPSI
jgi:hypothetical protein